MTKKISVSELNLFTECQRCFWLHHHGKPRPRTPFPSLPNGMDAVFREHFTSHAIEGTVPAEISSTGTTLYRDGDDWTNPRKGIWMQDEEGNYLHGVLDCILEQDGELIVLDFKTRGTAPHASTPEYSRLQLSLYTLLLQAQGQKVGDAAYLLFYHPKTVQSTTPATAKIEFHASLTKVLVNPKYAKLVFHRAINCLTNPMPRSMCAFCQDTPQLVSNDSQGIAVRPRSYA